ncbi:MAG: c-type cytochrome [Halieaceae bacterium]|jgi:cytochrome c oxidase subunit 2|nr:c-type cytochrome [Halieaceae bacterium]
MNNKTTRWMALIVAVLTLWGCGESDKTTDNSIQTADALINPQHAGAGDYATQCLSCHGAQGLGQEALQAPALTSLDTVYIARQLHHFRDGVRGAHPEDTHGSIMAASSVGLSDSNIDDLAGYIDALPNALPVATIKGDIAQGKDYHLNLCSACHGSNALGNVALEAPALAGLNDWYVLSQYEKFRGGLRGAHPQDRWGVQMVRLAPAITDTDILESIAAYLATLPPEA